jgi:hypothetical protein
MVKIKMLVTLLTTVSPQEIKSTLTGEKKLGDSAAGGSIFGISFGLILGVLAVALNYRRNRSIFYAILAFFFSEIYLAWFAITAIINRK